MKKLDIGFEHNPTQPPKKFKKKSTKKDLQQLKNELFDLQNTLFASEKFALLIILQGMDTSGKDSTIRHVFSGINPQGCNVKSFKKPTKIELAHDFLWRISAALPEKRMIKIFNRSQYEDILYPMAHRLLNDEELKERLTIINQFEKHLQRSGTVVLKFYLHISHKKQLKRLQQRLDDPNKNWKYNSEDKAESKIWDDYLQAYQFVINGSSAECPWIIIPSDKKWYRNFIVAKTVIEQLKCMHLKYPQ